MLNVLTYLHICNNIKIAINGTKQVYSGIINRQDTKGNTQEKTYTTAVVNFAVCLANHWVDGFILST